MSLFDKPLFIFEMANNHQGNVEHGKTIIRAMKQEALPYEKEFNFAVKFQYRDLDTFIHPDYQKRFDIKNVKRFQETRLSEEEFLELKTEVEHQGMFTVCTPFDENSVDAVIKHGYNAVKIASCSFNDWPLLEKIAKTGMPVIASTAGSSLDRIDRVVNFFCHRGIELALMHCVAEYPTEDEKLQINQITLYRERYPKLIIGFSTHENPGHLDPVKIAIAKGARIFEKHVGVPTDEIVLNGYSANPEQVGSWLKAAWDAYKICGIGQMRYEPDEKEKADLAALERGVFAQSDLSQGMLVTGKSRFLAFPCQPGQLKASDLSKYSRIVLKKNIEKNTPIMTEDVEITDSSEEIRNIVFDIMHLLKKSHVVIPVNSQCEISHHYGLENFRKTGVAIINCVNRAYCKKILVVLPGQSHPSHYHKLKEETFTVLYGNLLVVCNNETKLAVPGESIVVEPGVEHSFSSTEGCVFEEVSTTHFVNDSFYDKQEEFSIPRKTTVYITKEMLDDLEL